MKNVVKFLVGVIMASFMAYGVVKYLGAPSENEFLLIFVVTLIVFSVFSVIAVPLEHMLLGKMSRMIEEARQTARGRTLSEGTDNLLKEVVRRHEDAVRRAFSGAPDSGKLFDFLDLYRRVKLVRMLVETETRTPRSSV